MTDFSEQPVVRAIHPASLPDEDLLAQCTLTRGRSSGPGGQHRNKVQTHVQLTHTPTGIGAQAGERREAEVNKRVAVRRLRFELAMQVRVAVPDGEIRSVLWKSRCKNQRIVCSAEHRDYPSMLAEALDVIQACGWDMKKASTRLDVSGSQLTKLIAKYPPALVMVNRQRQERGMHTLKR